MFPVVSALEKQPSAVFKGDALQSIPEMCELRDETVLLQIVLLVPDCPSNIVSTCPRGFLMGPRHPDSRIWHPGNLGRNCQQHSHLRSWRAKGQGLPQLT